jgi:hypothetical protein
MQTTLLKTPIAARVLGVPYTKLANLVRLGKMVPPEKDSSGDYVWEADDLERAREALQRIRPYTVRSIAAVVAATE